MEAKIFFNQTIWSKPLIMYSSFSSHLQQWGTFEDKSYIFFTEKRRTASTTGYQDFPCWLYDNEGLASRLDPPIAQSYNISGKHGVSTQWVQNLYLLWCTCLWNGWDLGLVSSKYEIWTRHVLKLWSCIFYWQVYMPHSDLHIFAVCWNDKSKLVTIFLYL